MVDLGTTITLYKNQRILRYFGFNSHHFGQKDTHQKNLHPTYDVSNPSSMLQVWVSSVLPTRVLSLKMIWYVDFATLYHFLESTYYPSPTESLVYIINNSTPFLLQRCFHLMIFLPSRNLLKSHSIICRIPVWLTCHLNLSFRHYF